MIKFFAGVIVTLAVLYPDNTKVVLGQAVDVVHNTLNGVLAKPVDAPSK